MYDTSVLEIDLSAVDHNMRLLRRIVGPRCGICPVVKADAYGLGAVRIARRLFQAGADMLAVYTARQAAELVGAAVGGDLLVLMPLRTIGRADGLYRALVCGRLHLSVHGGDHLEDLVRLSERYAVCIPLHVELDTGMSRGGCGLDEAPAVLEHIARHPRLRLAGLYTHFASAETDERQTSVQEARFDRIVCEHGPLIPPGCLIHAANTCATLRDPRHHRTMVRIGAAWAGYGVELIRGGRMIPDATSLQPAVTWSSRITQVKHIEAGVTVGYGARWTARRRSLIGLVPVGYADGYPYSLGGNGEHAGGRVAVLVDTPHGCLRSYAPVVGAVNMDQITIDLTDLAGQADVSSRPGVGTPVELISPDREAPNHLVTLAQAAGTIPYELLCRLNPKIRRVYHESPAAIEVFASPADAAIPAAAG
ncbi:MAG: alanine racemase [Planctomycetota bacterium]|nr:alanine racemase [Planctomycetota bacterium]